MSDNVLRQFTSRLTKPELDNELNPDQNDDLGSFGWLRGVRDRALMLELRKKDGSIKALGYAWLEGVEFDPSEGITLRFTRETVKIVGRNLNKEARPNVKLLDGLLRHKVPWVQESASAALLTADKPATVIESIEW